MRDNPLAIAEGDATAPIIVGLNPVTSVTASNQAAVTFTGLSSAFSVFELELEGVLPVTTGTTLQLQCSTDNGSTWIAGSTNYYANYTVNSGTGTAAEGSGGGTAMALTKASDVLNNANLGVNGVVKLFNLTTTGKQKAATWHTQYGSSTGGYSTTVGGGTPQTQGTAINAVRLLFSSGNVSSGRVVLRGLRKP